MTIDFTNSAGKGAQPRPFSDYEQYKSNWDLIFNKKKEEVVKEQQIEVDKQEVKD